MNKQVLLTGVLCVLLLAGCTQTVLEKQEQRVIDRHNSIPADAVKMTPNSDVHPVVSYSDEYIDPVPLPSPISTAGAEDSAFITPDGQTLFFWFTPYVKVPVEQQLFDGVTGIYVTQKTGQGWSTPRRVLVSEAGVISLDGCAFVEGTSIWTCAAREGHACPEYSGGLCWFTATLDSSKTLGRNAQRVLFPDEWEVGELHIHNDELYYHSKRSGGKGGMDIWVLTKDSTGAWSAPKNVAELNTERDEGFPALSPDGQELWISRDYALWRSKRTSTGWSEPEKMFGPLAGEASIDQYGNVYFTHHYFVEDEMIEADIYVAAKKENS